ncbi:unnamed protein product [Urochloa humidicola]
MGCAGKMWLLLVVGVTLFLPNSIIATREANNCLRKCGDISIPYPFGIGRGCFLHEDFEVMCQHDQASISMGNGTYSKLLDISLLGGEVRIQNSKGIGRSCNYTNNTMDYKHGLFNYLGNSMKLSSTKNKFTAIGCATVATIVGFMDLYTTMNDSYNYYYSDLYTSGCESFCESEENISNECNGMGCCQTPIPGNMSFYLLSFVNSSIVLPIIDEFPLDASQNFSPCSYAFVAEDNWFKFNSSDAKQTNFQKQEWVSLVLDWVVGAQTCAQAVMNSTSYACISKKSQCVDTHNGPGYRCNCSPGYEGNPYLDEGCQDINECDNPSLYPCINGTCTNTNGSYDCSCPPGTHSNDPKSTPCIQTLGSNQPQVKIIIGTSIGFVVLVIFVSSLLIQCQKRQLANEKEKFFKRNGGNILYQQILSKQIDTVIIFTIEDLKKATNNYDRSRELGVGGHGTVYRGILDDNKVVAVKRSKIMNVIQTEEFVQEIIILSQLNHRNVVRLLGCCLEVEVPILVYEYIPNGTLFQLIHGNHGRTPVSLEDRLRIAQESAEALEYLHLSINHPIVHGDVKSLNILLDDNYMAKVTDFGASRMLPKDAVQLMTMVQGTLGYLDPEYLQERKLTEKSDVYSFGVVLLELITRKTAIYFEGHEEGKNLASSFFEAMKHDRVESMLDTSIMGVGMEELLQEVVKLARLCLSFKGEERPSMTQVADNLKAIRSTWREILLLKHEETHRQIERLSMDDPVPVGDLSPSMSYTAQMLGLDIEAPTTYHTGIASMG